MPRRSALFVVLALATAVASADERLRWLGTTEIAKGNGERGPWRQNESRYDFVDDPAVVIDDAGAIYGAWVDQARKDVFFRRPGGQPLNVSRSADTFSWLPRLALAPGDPARIYVLWQEIIFSGGSHGGDIVFARSEDGGRSFSAPLNLSNSVAGDGKGRTTREHWHNGSLDIVAGPDSLVYAAWTEYEGRLWLAVSTDGGRRFAAPVRIASDDRRPARAPSLAIGPDRSLHLAWTVGEDASAAIRVARSTDGGARFGEPVLVAAGRGYSDAPKLAVDRKGVVHLTFASGERVVYSRSNDQARRFDAPRALDKSRGAFPSLALDEANGVFITWELRRGLRIAVSRDGGETFTQAADVPQSADPNGAPNGGTQGLLMRKLAVNARGEVLVANSSFRAGHQSRVWLVRAESRN